MTEFITEFERDESGREVAAVFISESGVRRAVIGAATADCAVCGTTNAECCLKGWGCCTTCLDSLADHAIPDPHRRVEGP